jgi:hypothetical protein
LRFGSIAGGDVFFSPAVPILAPFGPPGYNTQAWDADGGQQDDQFASPAGFVVGPGLGLERERLPLPISSSVPDNLDALELADIAALPAAPGGLYFSLDQLGSGTAAANGVSGAAIGLAPGGAGPVGLFVGAAPLGLDLIGGPGTDDVDALIVQDNPPVGVFGAVVDCVVFSVSRGSAVIGAPAFLSAIPISATDLLVDPSCALGAPAPPGTLPAIAVTGESLGLCTSRSGSCFMGEDDLDAADTCSGPDADGDGTCDLFDPCPNVTSASPAGPRGLKKVQLVYKATGPGSLDDAPKVSKAVFQTAAAFDPATTHDVHVTLVNTGTAATVFSVNLAAGPPWTQADPSRKKWKYLELISPPPLGVRKVSIVESPAGSGIYKFKMTGKLTNIAGPAINLATDQLQAVVEIEQAGAGVCFSRTAQRCSQGATNDKCRALQMNK